MLITSHLVFKIKVFISFSKYESMVFENSLTITNLLLYNICKYKLKNSLKKDNFLMATFWQQKIRKS